MPEGLAILPTYILQEPHFFQLHLILQRLESSLEVTPQ